MSLKSLKDFSPKEAVDLALDQRGVRERLVDLGISEEVVKNFLITRQATADAGMKLAWGIQHLTNDGELRCDVREISTIIDMTRGKIAILEELLIFGD